MGTTWQDRLAAAVVAGRGVRLSAYESLEAWALMPVVPAAPAARRAYVCECDTPVTEQDGQMLDALTVNHGSPGGPCRILARINERRAAAPEGAER